MLFPHFIKNTKSTLVNTYRNRGWMGLWETVVLPVGLPVLLGLGMSVLLAMFIVNGSWALVLGLLLAVPAAVLFNTYPFSAILIWIVLMPFLQATPNSTWRTAYWIIHRAMPILALGVVMLSRLARLNKTRYPVRLGPAELSIVLFLALAVINTLWRKPDPMPTLFEFYDWVFVPICLYFLVRFVLPGRKDMERLIPVALFIVLLESAAGILRWFVPEMLPVEWVESHTERSTGTLLYPNAYVTTLVFFSFLLYHRAMDHKSRLLRVVFLLAFGLGVLGIFVSFSRGSWLGSAIAAVGLFVLYPKATFRLLLVVVLVMVILAGGPMADQFDFARDRLQSADTASDRWVIWDAGLRMIAAKPLVGWGYGDYSLYAGNFQRAVMNYVAPNAHASHNAYLTIAGELGLPALILWLFPVAWWFRLSFRAGPRMPKKGFWSRSLLVVLWLVILIHVVSTFFSDMRYSTFGQGMWWITLGFIANMVSIYLQADPDSTVPARPASQLDASGSTG